MTRLTMTLLLLVGFSCCYAGENPLCAAVCHCELATMDCARAYLSIVPPIDDWLVDVERIDLSTNTITALDTELSHDKLQVLDLSNNRIQSIIQPAFGGLKSLQYLNLANNQIRSFEDNGFYGLDHLKSLNISGNGLKTLPDDLFYNFIGLRELSLADNPLIHVDPLHFNRMIALRWLDMSNIEAYMLPGNIFHNTLKLEFLDLSGNDFHDVPTDALRSAQNLKILKFNENPIDHLDKKSFRKLGSLTSLHLSEMDQLSRVMEGTFSPLGNLTSLEMKYNRRLTLLHSMAFEGLSNSSRPVLQEIDLEGNQLTSLSGSMLQCGRMRKFNVQKNPFNCDCNIKWLKKCHLQMIYAVDLKCHSPAGVSGMPLLGLDEDELLCPLQLSPQARVEHTEHVVRSVILGAAAGTLLLAAAGTALMFKRKSLRSWFRFKRQGPGAVYYVRARANPREV